MHWKKVNRKRVSWKAKRRTMKCKVTGVKTRGAQNKTASH